MLRKSATGPLLVALLVLASGAVVGLAAGSAAPASTPADVSPVQVAMDDEHQGNETAGNETAGNETAANETAANETAANETAMNETAANATQPNATIQNATASVTFLNQTSDGTAVVVSQSSLPEGGFVVIHLGNRTSPGNFSVGPVVGNSSYLEPGEHANLTVSLDRALNESQWLVAMPHRDTNDNQVYEFPEADDPYFEDGSIPVIDPAYVTVEPGAAMNVTEPMPAANVTAENETAMNETAVGNETAANETAMGNETAGNETMGNESASVQFPDV